MEFYSMQEVVQVGVIQGGDTMQALLRLMSTLYAPQFMTGSLWPESIKKDFIGMPTQTSPVTHDFASACIALVHSDCKQTKFMPNILQTPILPQLSSVYSCAGQLHRFLARLTETSHALKGRTVLYLPRGNMADPVAAAADKVLFAHHAE